MKIATLLVCLSAFAAAASAATNYDVKLRYPATVAGTELKADEYRLVVTGKTATLKGANGITGQVTHDDNGNKYPVTALHYRTVDGKKILEEIDLGGTDSKVVFADSGAKSGN